MKMSANKTRKYFEHCMTQGQHDDFWRWVISLPHPKDTYKLRWNDNPRGCFIGDTHGEVKESASFQEIEKSLERVGPHAHTIYHELIREYLDLKGLTPQLKEFCRANWHGRMKMYVANERARCNIAKLHSEYHPQKVSNGNCPSFAHILQKLGIEYRQNILADRLEIRRDGGNWMPADLYDNDAIRLEITCRYLDQDGYPIFPAKSRDRFLGNLMYYECAPKVNPWKDYLESLEWDGIKRLDNLLPCLFGAKPDKLSEWAMRHLFLVAIDTNYKRTHFHKFTPVLWGPVGIGKRAFIQAVLPAISPIPGEWYGDGMAATPEGLAHRNYTQSYRTYTRGRIIVDMSKHLCIDVEGMAWDLNHVANSDSDLERGKDCARTYAIIGTIDDVNRMPADAYFNIRWIPVPLKHGHIWSMLYYIHRYRDLLWAEAFHLYNEGAGAVSEYLKVREKAHKMKPKWWKRELPDEQYLKSRGVA